MNETIVWDLVSLNHGLMLEAIPNIVITVIYLVLGIMGNTAVIYVYIVKMKCLYSEKFFIPVLAIIDVITCIINCPFIITLDCMQINFVYGNVCKIMMFMAHLGPTSSGILLSVIAIQRFLKICRPYGKQMTLRWKRTCLLLSIMMSVICNSLTLELYGHAHSYDMLQHIYPLIFVNVTTCDILDKYKQSNILRVYNTIMLILCICVITLIYVCYTFILRRSFLQIKCETCSPGVSKTRSTETSFQNTKIQNKRTKYMRSLRKSAINWRFSVMFFSLTTTSAIAFVPNTLMKFISNGDSSYIARTFGSNLTLYRFLYHCYVINSVVNPFIYALFDHKFRANLKRLCRMNPLQIADSQISVSQLAMPSLLNPQ